MCSLGRGALEGWTAHDRFAHGPLLGTCLDPGQRQSVRYDGLQRWQQVRSARWNVKLAGARAVGADIVRRWVHRDGHPHVRASGSGSSQVDVRKPAHQVHMHNLRGGAGRLGPWANSRHRS